MGEERRKRVGLGVWDVGRRTWESEAAGRAVIEMAHM